MLCLLVLKSFYWDVVGIQMHLIYNNNLKIILYDIKAVKLTKKQNK